MRGVARITFDGGGFILPVRTSYDRQLALEHVQQCAKRRGRVFFDYDGQQWTVSRADEHSPECVVCRQKPDNLTYVRAGRCFCHPCARRDLR